MAADRARSITADATPRTLRVRHETRYAHAAPVALAHHLAHLRPRDFDGQSIADWQLDIDPVPDGAGLDAGRDVFGNWRLAFSHSALHDALRVVSSFSARTSRPAVAGAGEPWHDVVAALSYRSGARMQPACEFTLDSPFVVRDAALARWGASAFGRGRPLLDATLALMHRVHAEFEYRSDSTDVATGALQAFALRRGVCQDYAHVMIGVLRSLGLAARYVSGYLLTDPAPGQPRLIGADASHAWVALWSPALGWVDLDPTNDLVVGNRHVSLAWGRDYADVAPLRGVIAGGSDARPEVSVSVSALT